MKVNIPANGNGALAEGLLFFRRFLRNPFTVGAIAPSSRFLARGMAHALELRSGIRVVEFGPGTGAFTSLLAEILPHDGRYLGIERDPVFVEVLKKRLPRFTYALNSVENLVSIARERDLLPIDHIISGLPFASLPRKTVLSVLEATHEVLREGGTFTTFQYIHAYPLPTARSFRLEMDRRFGPPFARKVVFRNIPPAFVLCWRKGGKRLS